MMMMMMMMVEDFVINSFHCRITIIDRSTENQVAISRVKGKLGVIRQISSVSIISMFVSSYWRHMNTEY